MGGAAMSYSSYGWSYSWELLERHSYRHCTNTGQLLEEIDFCRIIFSLKLLFRFLHMGHLLFFTPYVPVTIWKPIWQERRKHRKEIKFELITMRGKKLCSCSTFKVWITLYFTDDFCVLVLFWNSLLPV